MLERITQNPWLQKLREGGLASVIPLPAAPSPLAQFPRLEGAELARQRLHEAIGALQDTGLSKIEAFRALRLEINKMEQGRWIAPVAQAKPAIEPPRRSSRRARLLRATGLY